MVVSSSTTMRDRITQLDQQTQNVKIYAACKWPFQHQGWRLNNSVADGLAPWDLGSHTDQITSTNQWRIKVMWSSDFRESLLEVERRSDFYITSTICTVHLTSEVHVRNANPCFKGGPRIRIRESSVPTASKGVIRE